MRRGVALIAVLAAGCPASHGDVDFDAGARRPDSGADSGGARADGGTPASDGGCTGDRCDEIVEMSAGHGHVCARRASGEVLCWGGNGSGHLGAGTTDSRVARVAVVGRGDAVEVSAGSFEMGGGHTCARKAAREVVCWGWNRFGQVGDGTTEDRWTPVRVAGLVGADEVEA